MQTNQTKGTNHVAWISGGGRMVSHLSADSGVPDRERE